MPKPAPYVRLLGDPEVESSAGRRAFRSDKRYLLLAFLACHRDWVDRARLARLFWPDHDSSAARHNLRQLVKRLSSLDWDPGIETGSGPEGERLRWAPATDLADLDAALAAGRWAEAQTLHRGRLLTGLRPDAEPAFDDWLERRRQELEDDVRRAFMVHAAALTAAGEHVAAARLYGHLVQADVFDEEALRAYMEASAVAGQPTKALAAFQRFSVRLDAEFDLAPVAATESLARRIRGAGREVVAPPFPLAGQTELGGRDGSPPWLVGRERELGDVHRLLANPECRLLTITGPGGVGKSALARRAAHELGGAYTDGCVYLSLGEARSTSGLFAAIAAHPALAQGSGVATDPAVLIGTRSLLLVLDDLDEYRLEAQRLPALLQRCPHLAIITTTRERLAVAKEWLLPLDGLPCPGADATSLELLASDAVSLFVAHAERLRPDFHLSDEGVRDVARVCRMVSGLPLALELAAAWTRALPVTVVADQIAEGLDMLSGGPSGATDRHASMRACIEHSWRRLSPGERRGWRALSVFRSPFDTLAAARVAEVALPQLMALVDKSLLRASPTGLFSFHPLMRAFAAERLEEESADEVLVREAHARHFMAAIDGANDLRGAARRAAVDVLTGSVEDVAAAWLWAVAAPADGVEARRQPVDEALLRWCYALSAICEDRARFSLAAELFEAAGTDLESRGGATPELLGTVLAQRGWHLQRVGRAGEADAAARSALSLLGDHTATPAWRTALQTRAGVALQLGRYGDAHELFAQALECAKASRSRAASEKRREIATLTGNLGVAKQLSGDRRGAAVLFRRQLRLAREAGDPVGTVSALSNLGNVLRLLNRGEDAMTALEEGLRMATDAGHDAIMPSLNVNLGVLHMQSGAYGTARRYLTTAAKLARDQGREALVVTSEHQLGRLALQVGEVEAARERFDTALDLAVRSASLVAVLDALAGLAWVGWRAGAAAAARCLADAVHRHEATSPGTRSWVAELQALAVESPDEGEAVHGSAPWGEGVTKALTLMDGGRLA